MDRLNITSCPICGSTHLEPTLTCVDHFATSEMFRLYRCRECQFLFTQGAPVEAEIGRYYEAPEYISHTDTQKGVVNHLYHKVRQLMLKRKHRLVEDKSHSESGTLLDIGCGTGYFPAYMQSKGWVVTAVEKSPAARKFAEEHFSLNVHPAEELDGLPAEKYDVITLWHVMEHLEHINEVWETLYRLLKPHGQLIVAVPNCSSYDAEKYGGCWAAYDVPRHLWHFTPATMQKLAAKHRFTMTDRLPMPFDAFYVSMLTEKNMRHSFPFLRGVVTGTMGWFHSLIRKERSSSMIYVFRKK